MRRVEQAISVPPLVAGAGHDSLGDQQGGPGERRVGPRDPGREFVHQLRGLAAPAQRVQRIHQAQHRLGAPHPIPLGPDLGEGGAGVFGRARGVVQRQEQPRQRRSGRDERPDGADPLGHRDHVDQEVHGLLGRPHRRKQRAVQQPRVQGRRGERGRRAAQPADAVHQALPTSRGLVHGGRHQLDHLRHPQVLGLIGDPARATRPTTPG
ncbi:hypothetical protein [Micromonospora yasonensis]|uniref:hypothetical protein n=1 Tax=Micromonospora yasonensis TaxID=1128667 RepID=UPI0038736877